VSSEPAGIGTERAGAWAGEKAFVEVDEGTQMLSRVPVQYLWCPSERKKET
jgi:hypothetical protein